jgi:hypothetical protein
MAPVTRILPSIEFCYQSFLMTLIGFARSRRRRSMPVPAYYPEAPRVPITPSICSFVYGSSLAEG